MNRISKERFGRQVLACRCVLAVIVVLAVLNVQRLNDLVDGLWQFLRENPFFRHDSFEPIESTIWFGVCFSVWVVIDFYLPALHIYRINSSESNEAWKGRESAAYRETLWYLAPWLLIDFFFPRRKLPLQSITFPKLCLEVCLALIFYDLFFFCGHFCLHNVQFLYKSIHARHHESIPIRAIDAIRHTPIDGTWDVACSVISLNLLRLHPLSRACFNLLAIWFIVEAHCGLDFPWMASNLIPGGIFAGPRIHDLHHRLYSKNFQKFFTHLDFFFGTLQIEDIQIKVD